MKKPNDITNLNRATETQNNINNFNSRQYAFSNDSNLFRQATEPEFRYDAEQTRYNALDEYLAGSPALTPPTPSPTLSIAKDKADLNKSPITEQYTERDQMMSQLGLMDSNNNYTDTYTNYIKAGNAPLTNGDKLLDIEKKEALFEKVNNNEMPLDTALMEAYGRDIMATMGYDVTSTAYWINKYQSHDFSNPFTNQYLMTQVKQAALQQYENDLASDWMNKRVSDTNLASLVGEELTGKKIKELFPNLSDAMRAMSDKEVERLVTLSSVNALTRIIDDGKGNYYYLHNNGELYALDGQAGENHGRIEFDQNGNVKYIDLNNNDLGLITHSAISGAVSVFTGIIGFATGIIDFVPTLFAKDDEDKWWLSNRWEQLLNDTTGLNWLVNDGYIDMSQEFTGKDLTHLVSSFVGTIAGTMALGGVTQSLKNASALATNKTKKAALNALSTGLRWQTGNLGTQGALPIGTAQSLGLKATTLSGETLEQAQSLLAKAWGRKIGMAAVSNAKSYINEVRALENERYTNFGSITDDEHNSIALKAACGALTRAAIDAFISGGMDDNQYQLWIGGDADTSNLKEIKEATKRIIDITSKDNVSLFKDELKEAYAPVRELLMKRSAIIANNSALDFVSNMLTASISTTLDEEGNAQGLMFEDMFNTKNLASSALNTLWFSTRSQIKEWNISLQTIGNAKDLFLKKVDNELKNSNYTTQEKAAIQQVRNDFNKFILESKSKTYEGKIIDAISKVSRKLGKVPKQFEESVKEVTDEYSKGVYREIAKQSDIIYQAQLAHYTKLNALDKSSNLPALIRIPKDILKAAVDFADGESSRRNAVVGKAAADNYNMNMIRQSVEEFSRQLPSEEQLKTLDEIRGDYKVKDIETTSGYKYSKTHKDVQVEPNDTLYVVKNNEQTTDNYKIELKSLDIMERLGLVIKVDTNGGDYVYKVNEGTDEVNWVQLNYLRQIVQSSVHKIMSTNDSAVRKETFNKMVNELYETDKIPRGMAASSITGLLSELSVIGKKVNQKGKVDSSKDLYFSKKETIDIFNEYRSKFGEPETTNEEVKKQFDLLKSMSDIVVAVQQDKTYKIDLSNENVWKAIEELKDDDRYSKSVKKILKAKENTPELFLNGSKSEVSYVEASLKAFGVDIGPEAKNEDLLANGEEGIKEYLRVNGVDNKTIEALGNKIKAIAQDMDNITNNSKEVTLFEDSGIVIVDLDKLTGKNTDRAIRQMILMGDSVDNEKKTLETLSTYSTGLAEEQKTLNRYKQENNSSLVAFNIKDSGSKNRLMKLLTDLNYEVNDKDIKGSLSNVHGISSALGKTVVLTDSKGNPIKGKSDYINDVSVTIDGKVYNMKDLHKVTLDGRELKQEDIVRYILASTRIENISVDLRPKQTTDKGVILPFSIMNRLKRGMSIITGYYGDTKDNKKNAGKTASLTGQDLVKIMGVKVGDSYEYDESLEKFFICEQAISLLTNKQNIQNEIIPLSKNEKNILLSQGIVAKNSKEAKDKGLFWEVRTVKSGKEQYDLVLASWVTESGDAYNTMMDKIYDKDFNMFKLFPLILVENDNRGKENVTGSQSDLITEGFLKTNKGFNRNLLGIELLNISLPWDDNNKTRARKFFTEMSNIAKKTLEDNNNLLELKHNGDFKKQDGELTYNQYMYGKNIKDPRILVYRNAMKVFEEEVKTGTAEDNNNETILLKNKASLTKIMEYMEKGGDINDLIKSLRTDYTLSAANKYNVQSYSNENGVIYNPSDSSKEIIVPYDYGIGQDIYSNNIGTPKDASWIDVNTVEKAISKINEIKEDRQSIEEFGNNLSVNFGVLEYAKNDVTRLLKIGGSSNGYIKIDDVDEIAELIFENYDKLLTNSSNAEAPKLKTEMEAVMKYLYGEAYKDVTAQIAKIFKNNLKLMNSTKEVQANVTGASISNDGTSSIGEAGTEDNPDKPFYSSDAIKQRQMLMNQVNRRQESDSRKVSNVLNNASSFIDEGLEEIKRNKEITLAKYTNAPWGATSENLSFERNFKADIMSKVNTRNKLVGSGLYEEGSEENLMKLATVLTDLNRSGEYVGEKAVYFLTDKKTGEIIERSESANLQDLFVNLINLDKDKRLENTVLVYADPGIGDNIAGLTMHAVDFSDTSNKKKYLTDLYKNFIYKNTKLSNASEVVRRVIKNPKDSKTLSNILQGIPTDKLSKLSFNRQMYDHIKEITKIPMEFDEFMVTVKGYGTVDFNQDMINALDNYVKETKGLDEFEPTQRVLLNNVINLAFGINPERLTEDQRNAVNSIKDNLSKQLILEDKIALRKNKKVYYAFNSIINKLLGPSTAQSIDLLTRDRTLTNMKTEMSNDDEDKMFVIGVDSNNNAIFGDTKNIRNIVESLKGNNGIIPYKNKVVLIDIETIYDTSKTNGDYRITNIGVIVMDYSNGEWKETKYDIFVDDLSEAEKATLFNNFKTKDSKYYKEEEGYKNITDKWLKSSKIDTTDGITKKLTTPQIRDLMSQIITDDSLLITYNGSNFDIPKMIESNMLSESIRGEQLDLKYLCDYSNIPSIVKTGKLSTRFDDGGLLSSKQHGATYDAETTLKLFKEVTGDVYNVKPLRNKILSDLTKDLSGLTEAEINTVLRMVDTAIHNSKTGVKNLNSLFTSDYAINNRNTTLARSIMEYQIKSRASDAFMAIKEASKDVYLSDKAKHALENNSYEVFNKLYAGALEVNPNLKRKDFIRTISKLNNSTKINNLLEMSEDEYFIQRLKNTFGITKDLSEIEGKDIFDVDPFEDKELSEDMKKNTELYELSPIIESVKTLFDVVGIKDPEQRKYLTRELLSVWNFADDIDNPLELINNDKPKKVETKTSRVLNDIYNRYTKDFDSVLALTEKGVYDLIGCVGVNEEVKDAITGNIHIVKPEDIVVTRKLFEDLVGTTLEDYLNRYNGKDGKISEYGLYSELLINPADNNNKIIPRRIIINADDDGYSMRVPETVIEILGSRDFDGDHLILLRPKMNSQKVLRLYSTNMFKAHGVQESVLNMLRGTVKYDNYLKDNYIVNWIGKNEDVLNICKKLDKDIDEISDSETGSLTGDIKTLDADKELLKNKIEEIVRELYNSSLDDNNKLSKGSEYYKRFGEESVEDVVKDAIKELGVTDVIDLTETGHKPIIYVNNPAIYLEDDSEEYEGTISQSRLSRSGKNKLIVEGVLHTNKAFYAPIDQVTGFIQKKLYDKLTPINITEKHAYSDLFNGSIYGSSTVWKYWKNLVPSKRESLIETIRYSMNNSLIKATKKDKAEFDSLLKKIDTELIKGNNASAFANYQILLKNIESFNMSKLDNEDFFSALTNKALIKEYEMRRGYINSINKLIEEKNKDTLRNLTLPSSDYNIKASTKYTYNKFISDMMEDDNKIKVTENIYDNIKPQKAFVIEYTGNINEQEDGYKKSYNENRLQEVGIRSGGKQRGVYSFAEDEVLYNEGTSNGQKVLFASNITIGRNYSILPDLLPKIVEGDEQYTIVRKGTTLAIDKNTGKKILSPCDAAVIGFKGNTLVLQGTKDLDSETKIVTDHGGKGPIRRGFSVVKGYSGETELTNEEIKSVVYILNKPTLNKSIASSNKPESHVSTTLTLKDKSGKEIKVTGYFVDVKPKVVETTVGWNKLDDRKISSLTMVFDSQTLGGVLHNNFNYINEDGSMTSEANAIKARDLMARHDIVQISNAYGIVSSLRMAAILNRLSDDELRKDFNITQDINKWKKNQIFNVRSGTQDYKNIIDTLLYRHPDLFKSDDPYEQRMLDILFTDKFEELINERINTGVSDIDTSELKSKRNASQVAGNGNIKTTSGKVDLKTEELDMSGNAKDYINFEDYYIDPFKFFEVVLGPKNRIDNYSMMTLLKKGKIPYGRFIKGSATYVNGFKSYTENRSGVRDKVTNDAEREIRNLSIEVGPKSYNTSKASNPVTMNKVVLNGQMESYDDNNRMYNYDYNGLLMDKILEANDFLKPANWSKTALMLYNLQNINKDDSVNSKYNYLSSNDNKLYSVKDSNIGIEWTKDGNAEFKVRDLIDVEGNKNEVLNKLNEESNYYQRYNLLDKEENRILKSEDILKSIDSKYASEESEKYLKYREDKQTIARDVLSKAYKEIDLVDPYTGEIKDEVTFDELYRNGEIPTIAHPETLRGGEECVFERSSLSRQGISEKTPEGILVSTAMKRMSSEAVFLEQKPDSLLTKVYTEVTRNGLNDEFEKYTRCRAILIEAENNRKLGINNGELQEDRLKYYGITKDDLIKTVKDFESKHKDIALMHDDYVKSVVELSNFVGMKTGQALYMCIPGIICPYKSTSKSINKAVAYSKVGSVLGLGKFDPVLQMRTNPRADTTAYQYDFFNSSKAAISELTKMAGLSELHVALKTAGALDNEGLIDKVYNIIDSVIDEKLNDKQNVYFRNTAEDKKASELILDEVSLLTRGTVNLNFDEDVTFANRFSIALKDITQNIDILISKFNDQYESDERIESYEEFNKLANMKNVPMEQAQAAKVISDMYYAKIICMNALMEHSNYNMREDFHKMFNAIQEDGYVLVNKYGQKIQRNGIVKPVCTSDTSNFLTNMEIQYNSGSDYRFEEFCLEKILSGEFYMMKKENADLLEEKAFTRKADGTFVSLLKKIGKWSASLQMALPSKMINRFISFTGFDYSMGISYSPKTAEWIPKARKELTAAYQSNGANLKPGDDLYEYFIREGQPIGVTGKDKVTFTENLEADTKAGKKLQSVLETMTDPLEFQNHLGRYAIYKTALESFRNGDPIYGPCYFMKDAIDSLRTDEDKAMMIMDYMLGSPGGFPELTKQTSGYMLYATFPMNFTRTLGAYGMSLGKLFNEGFTANNYKDWERTIVSPSMGLAAITGMSMLINWLICKLCGLDEKETEENAIRLDTLDPLGTVLGSTPSFSSSTMNPVGNINEMFVEPFTNEYNDTVVKKAFGFTNQNILSHLNPVFKIPVEVATGYELFGTSPINTKSSYNQVENGIRKVLGTVIGSSVANSLVDQYKLKQYNGDSEAETIKKGFVYGISNSLGNEKSWKKNVSNYYDKINDVRNYQIKTSGGSYSDEVEDYIYSNQMEAKRSTKSKYGSYNADDFQRINKLVKNAMKKREDANTVYAIIMDAYSSGVSEVTLKAVLNNNSLARRIDNLKDRDKYLDSLSAKEYNNLTKALQYEEMCYPLLKEFFPKKNSYTLKNRTKYSTYNSSSYGSSGKVYPQKFYPTTSYKKSAFNKPGYDYKKVSVNVSPEMGVWNNDYNKIIDLDNWNNNTYKRIKPLEKGGGK